ncbi:MAG: hypothetical protein IJD33_06065 [Clostridia bacterium]|nr:hypothetical protein [Clostridia bacterium]
MLLSQLFQKRIYTGETPRGIIVGVDFSLRNYTIKHLLCCTQKTASDQTQHPDFAVNVSCVSAVADKVSLTRIRPALPKTQAKLFPALPVYSHDGTFLGKLTDGETDGFTVIELTTDQGNAFPPSAISVCRDAIILHKKSPYPLGQRVPSPMLSQLQTGETFITKTLLRQALQRGALIKLTLSLSPFDLLSEQPE